MARSDVDANLQPGDVPYGEDWHDADVAWAWTQAADGVRPWRKWIRAAFAERIAVGGASAAVVVSVASASSAAPAADSSASTAYAAGAPGAVAAAGVAPAAATAASAGLRVLELGAGPGLLAEAILARNPALGRYVLFDLSDAMLALARERLLEYPAAEFVRGDFKSPDWSESVGPPFDFVVSMQAIHELRHKRHAPEVYRRIRELLAPGGQVLICDHIPLDESEKSQKLYQTEAEQLDALAAAGFSEIEVVLAIDKLRLYAGMC